MPSAARRTTIAFLALTAAAGCAGGTGEATTPSRQSTRTTRAAPPTTAPSGHPVEFTVAGPAITLRPPECSPGCPVPYTQTGTVTGSMSGAVTGAGAVRVRGTTFTGATTFLFRGRVDGCGEGTLALRRREDGDLEEKTVTGTWDIAPGYTTGALAPVAGSGTIAAAEGDPGAGRIASVFRGRIDCDGATVDAVEPPALEDDFAVQFESTTPAPPVATPVCESSGSGGCVFPTTQHPTYTGSFEGTGAAEGDGVVKPAPKGGSFSYVATALEVVTAHVPQCGRGTIVVRTISQFDGRELATTWELVAGFGSGALSDARGSGTARGVRKSDGTYVATSRGRITCG